MRHCALFQRRETTWQLRREVTELQFHFGSSRFFCSMRRCFRASACCFWFVLPQVLMWGCAPFVRTGCVDGKTPVGAFRGTVWTGADLEGPTSRCGQVWPKPTLAKTHFCETNVGSNQWPNNKLSLDKPRLAQTCCYVAKN